MKTTRSQQQVLGIMVTGRMVEAVLLQQTEEGPAVVRRFTRQRTSGSGRGPTLPAHVPDVQSENTGEDFTIQFGDASGSASEMFLSSEFAGMDAGDDAAAAAAASFDVELADILAECRDAGFMDPLVGFAVGSGEVVQVELRIPREGRKKRTERSKLVKLLKQQHDGPVDEERVSFIAMTATDDDDERHLALLPRINDAVTSTLHGLKNRRDVRMPAVRLMDSEISLYLGLARKALRIHQEVPELDLGGDGSPSGKSKDKSETEPRTSLVVRAGVEDTLVMFMRGEAPMYVERLRSLTSMDAPDTICSRILLQQDEYGVGEVHHVLVLSADRENELVETFQTFFPDACCERLADHVPSLKTGFSNEESSRTLVPATAVGLRLLGDKRNEGIFEPVNLVMRKFTRRSPKLPFTWHIAALAVVLFFSVFFFGIRYAALQYEIKDYHQKLREYPPQIADTDIRSLQSRIDSLRGTSARYLHALDVLDTLMVGSDRWSRALEETSDGTASVAGIWVESWRPIGQQRVRLNGNATSRDRVVRLAERMEGHIEALTFSEIRDWPVYSFVLDITLRDELPEAAEYLRQQALSELESPRTASTADTVSPSQEGAPVSRTSLPATR